MNSKCGVQSKRRRESHESCVCILGFPACGCQKKSVVYEMECRHAAVQRGKLFNDDRTKHCLSKLSTLFVSSMHITRKRHYIQENINYKRTSATREHRCGQSILPLAPSPPQKKTSKREGKKIKTKKISLNTLTF